MVKPTLYTDCDGVVFDTDEVTDMIMIELGLNPKNRAHRDYYFTYLADWNEIFRRTKPINNSIEKIKILKESGQFEDVKILTILSGRYREEGVKREVFGDCLPGIEVITLQYGLSKALVIPNIRNSILVDDSLFNCEGVRKYQGTAIEFSRNNRDLNNNIINDLIDIPNTIGVKELLKTRNF